MFDYDHYLANKLRNNKIDRMYRDLMVIGRLDISQDIKDHLIYTYKMGEKERSAKWNFKKVMNELRLYAYYSFGLFQEVPWPTILDEELEKIAGSDA